MANLRNKNYNAGKYLQAALVRNKIPFLGKLKLWIINAKLGIENEILNFFRWLLYKKAGDYKRILIFRTGSLGDSINAIPSIQAIADSFPSAHIDILTNAGKKNLVGIQYLIQENLYKEIIDYNEFQKYELFRLLKQKKYDMIIQLPQVDAGFISLLRDMIVFSRIAPVGLGWYVSQTRWFRKTQARYVLFKNESDRLLTYIGRMGYTINNPTPTLTIQNSDISYVEDLVSDYNIDDGKVKICIVVGAKRSQNRWPIDYFAKVIHRFSTRARVMLIGSADDNLLVEPLLNIPGVINFCGKLTPMQSAALIRICDLTLSNDTGPMHMSYAVKTPTIALFSSRDLPGKWYPPAEPKNIVFRAKDIICEACFSETCKNNICMQAIKPEKVIEAMEKLIEMKTSHL